MTTSTFVKDIVEQLDETMRLIDEASEQILGLTGRARNLAALARRYVAEGEADQHKAERMKVATERLDHGIERATQQFIERAERRLDEQAAGHSLTALLGSGGASISNDPAAKVADDLHTAYDATAAKPLGVEVMPSVGRALEEAAVQFVKDTLPTSIDQMLHQAYDVPMPEMVSIEISHPLLSPGEEKTEAADVAPQPQEAASVEPLHPDLVWMTMTQDGSEPASADQAAGPEAGQEEVSSSQAALSPAEPPPPAPAGQQDYMVAPQFGRDSSRTAAATCDDLYEQVLTLWSTTEKTEMQIARATNSTLSLVRTYLAQARADGDERIEARRKGKLKDRGILKAGAEDAPAESRIAKALKEAAMDEMPKREISKGVCVVDMTRNLVIGLKGMKTMKPEECRVVAFLNDGNCYRVNTIAEECGWHDAKYLGQCMVSIMERLQDVGVQLTAIPGLGWKLKAAA